jgi:Bardet-Biedl syndrome 4 protein
MGRYKQALEVYFKAEQIMARPDYEVYHNIGNIGFHFPFNSSKLMNFKCLFTPGELLLRNVSAQDEKVNSSKTVLDAIEYFKRALIDSKQPKTYYKLAEIYAKQNDFHKAIEMYESSLQ